MALCNCSDLCICGSRLYPHYPLTDGKSYEPIFLRLPLGINQLSLANQFYLREPRTLINPGTVFINRITRAPIGLAQNQALGALDTTQTLLVAVPRSLQPNSTQEYAFVCRK